jgi:hypothetical protein
MLYAFTESPLIKNELLNNSLLANNTSPKSKKLIDFDKYNKVI